ncbi:hypothetical protein GCM10009837_26320 [Streptomyces durmitorensis]|uniref:Uncharacterized protein n=1 Tax=Streptomyces durmitorensis TaxID=319947 RepID=A0ABY4PTE0_9ACTN|nr:hypothetical protein [Streptomyces durmitorensis]UQT56707.1 hypothetical protein M4V62_17275 [Streptomyces durmitorensis]
MIPMNQYKSARTEADHIAGLMRAALIRAGLSEEDASRVRGLVTGNGRAYVEVGVLRVAAANTLLEALPLAGATHTNSGDAPTLRAKSF